MVGKFFTIKPKVFWQTFFTMKPKVFLTLTKGRKRNFSQNFKSPRSRNLPFSMWEKKSLKMTKTFQLKIKISPF